MTGKMTGKVALISGAGGTKGLALAQLLVREGATVFVSDVDVGRVSGIAAEVEVPERVRHFKLDVGKEADWQRAIATVIETAGKLDILINSARLFGIGMVTDLSLDEWRCYTAANLDGTFLGAKYALPHLIAAGGGAIVNVISLAAIRPTDNTPNYSACNAAAMNLLQTIAIQYGRYGVRANGVIVGFSANSPVGDAHEVAKRVVPVGRPANGADIARAVVWLASDESSYATGAGLVLDGGLSLALRL